MWCFNVFLTDDECLMNVHSTKHRKAKRIRKKTPFLLPQEKHQLQSAFSKYVSPDVVDQIILHPEVMHLGGEKQFLSCI